MYSCLYQLLVMLVLGICVCNINASSLIFQVRHSQRANCPLLSTWVLCKEDGTIESAHCTCMAGLCEACSHVGAILFYLESAVRVRKTCTQLDCAWKSPRFVETIPYARIADIYRSLNPKLVSAATKEEEPIYIVMMFLIQNCLSLGWRSV